MANVNQIYNFLNDTAKEMVGGSHITVKDTSSLVSLGDTILSSDTATEQFYSKLVDKIGMTYVKYRELTKDALSDILRTPMDFGIILQKVNTSEIARAVENGSWTNQKNPFANEKDTTITLEYVKKAKEGCKLFSVINLLTTLSFVFVAMKVFKKH